MVSRQHKRSMWIKLSHRFLTWLSFAVVLPLVTAVSVTSQAQQLHIAHCVAACPEGSPATNDLIIRNLFAVSVNKQTGMGDWVAYRVLADTVGVASLLSRQWRADKFLDLADSSGLAQGPGYSGPGSVDPSEESYRVSEFSNVADKQGRLVPMSSFAGTAYWSDINLTSNRTLMSNGLRIGPWSRLDQSINSLAQTQQEVFVISGVIYSADLGQGTPVEIGAEPPAFFKVIATVEGGVSAFIFPQDLRQSASYCEQSLSLDALQSRTGLRIFPQQSAWPLGSLNDSLHCP